MKNQKISFESSGEVVRGTLITDGKESIVPGFLLLHGWRGSEVGYVSIAEEMVRKFGVVCLTINLRGHGNSDGRARQEQYSRLQHLNDVKMACNFLATHPRVSYEQIGGFASSYGAYLLSMAASECNWRWLIFRAPALYPDRGFRTSKAVVVNDRLRRLRQSIVHPSKNRALYRLRHHFTGNMLIVGGASDEDIPEATLKNFERVVANNNREVTLRVLPGADHMLSTPKMRDDFNVVFYGWLEKVLK